MESMISIIEELSLLKSITIRPILIFSASKNNIRGGLESEA